MNAEQLIEIELIKQLKAKYFRALDTKDWPLMRSCLADECIAEYDGGKYSFEGGDAIVEFFSQFMSDPKLIFMHHGHHPEITLSGTSATGVWYLNDKVISLHPSEEFPAGTTLEGAGFYHDEYTKASGEWQIKRTGYQRTFEEVYSREGTELKFNRFAE